MQEIYCQIHGRVQMVMFRDFACRKARARKLVGYVRNRPDGSVEVLAQGPRETLETYIKLLEKGPLFADVERVEVEWREPKEQFETFEIRF